jgi:hypothetical protein
MRVWGSLLQGMPGMAQGLPQALQAMAQAQAAGQGMGPGGLDPYIPLLPSFSLDSFFAGCEPGSEAAARAAQQAAAVGGAAAAQQQLAGMEHVMPAWEELGANLAPNGPSGSLQGGVDWRVRARLSTHGAQVKHCRRLGVFHLS